MEARRRFSTCCIICGHGNLSSKCPGDNDPLLESLNKFLKQIGVQGEVSPQEVRLCEECLSGVETAVECRGQVDEVERDVRSLQRIILRMMRQLTSLQSNYLEEMRGLERKMRESEEESVEGMPKVSDNGGTRRMSQISRGTTSTARAAFQQGICDVVMDLGGFQDAAATEATSAPTTSPPPEHVDGMEEPSLPPKQEWDSLTFPSEENYVPQEDPLSTENETVNTEYAIYSETIVKSEESLQVQVVDEESQAQNNSSAVTDSTSSTSQGKKKRSGGASKTRAWRSAPCGYCGMRFVSPSALKVHVLTHTGERPYKCSLCPAAFIKSSNLNRHLISHSGEKRFSCSVCGQRFTSKHWMMDHRKKQHLNND